MKKYIVTSTQFMGELVFVYNDNYLVQMDIDALSNNKGLLRSIYLKLPINIQALLSWLNTSTTMKIREVPPDLTFDNFWKTFNYKVGNKSKCEKIFNSLPDEKKALALLKISAYRKYVENTGIAMIYPERYLSQERYENEF